MNERIAQLRSELGLTLKEFGTAIGMSPGGLADVESGRNRVQERHIKLIMAAFPQVSESWIRDGVGPMFREQSPLDIITGFDFPAAVSEIFGRLVEKYQRLTPDEQRVMDRYIQSVISDLSAPRSKEAEIEERAEEYKAELRAEASDPGKSSVSPDTDENIG